MYRLTKKIVAIALAVTFVLFIHINIIFIPSINTMKKQVYKEYNVLGNTFSYKLPNDWTTWIQTFEGGEIIYNMFFKSPDSKVNGFIQVSNINKPLKQYLEESKEAAVGAVDFKYFDIKPIMVGRNTGFLLRYERPNSEGEYYSGYEAFVEGKNGKVYRASFFVKEKDWRQYYLMIFNTIIQSFNIK